MRNIFLVFLLFFLISCASCPSHRLAYAWTDLNTCTLTKVWGDPDRVILLPNRHKIFIYAKQPYSNCFMPPLQQIKLYRASCGCITTYGFGRATTYVSTPYPCFVQFEADAKHQIVDAKVCGHCTIQPREENLNPFCWNTCCD